MEQTIEPALELGEVELAATTALGWMSEWAPATPRSDDILERILEALPPHSELRPQIGLCWRCGGSSKMIPNIGELRIWLGERHKRLAMQRSLQKSSR